MLVTSHPRPVREAIERHRRALDENPSGYFEEKFFTIDAEVRAAAAAIHGRRARRHRPDRQHHHGPGGAVRRAAAAGRAAGADHHPRPLRHPREPAAGRRRAPAAAPRVRKVALYDKPSAAAEEEIVRRLVAAVEPRTRVVAVTWVHSSTGVKLPVRRLAAGDRRSEPQARRRRSRSCLRVDGVHALRRRAREPARARLRLLRRRLPQVDVRSARHRRVVGPPGRLEGTRRPDRPVRAAALHRLDQGPRPLRAARRCWPPRAASTRSSTAGPWARRSPSTGASAANGSPSASTRWPRNTRRGWPPCPTSPCTRRCRRRCPPG